jgi:aspartate/methionine/tyrosine aminotransferase
MKLASRMGRLGTETAFEVLAKARALEAQGKEIIHLEIGEPDFDTPRNIVNAGVAALQSGWTHYGPSAGLPELRAAIAKDVSDSRGVPFTADQVVVTPGGKPIMFYIIMAMAEEGDEVLYPNPGFPIYESMINFVGATAVPVPLREECEFRIDLDEFRSLITPRTRLAIINSPQNPTGGVLSKDDLKEIARLAVKHDFWVLADEIYGRCLYDGIADSITTFPGMLDRTIVLDGFSKTYAMTGWRIGYGVMPLELAPHISRLMTNSNSCTASFTQRAALEAITGPQDDAMRMVTEFKARRDVIVDGLNAIPEISCLRPRGAFYVFPNIRKLGKSSREVADHLLYQGGVAALSGTAFGKYGEGYLRLSYANSVANIEKALARIRAAVTTL